MKPTCRTAGKTSQTYRPSLFWSCACKEMTTNPQGSISPPEVFNCIPQAWIVICINVFSNSRMKVWAVFVLLLVFSLSIFIQKVQAQCGDYPGSSSCITCHEKEGAKPVSGTGIWPAIHAAKDCCWNCHAGNTRVNDKVLALEGLLVHPLEDVYTDCYNCHPIDYLQRRRTIWRNPWSHPCQPSHANPSPQDRCTTKADLDFLPGFTRSSLKSPPGLWSHRGF